MLYLPLYTIKQSEFHNKVCKFLVVHSLWIGYGLNGRKMAVRIVKATQSFVFFFPSAQSVVIYCTSSLLVEDKASGTWSLQLANIQCQMLRNNGFIPPFFRRLDCVLLYQAKTQLYFHLLPFLSDLLPLYFLWLKQKNKLYLAMRWEVLCSNPGWGKTLSSTKSPELPWSPPSFPLNGYRFCVPGLKRPSSKFDH